MKKPGLIILCLVLSGPGQVFGQTAGKLHTSLYLCPFQALMPPLPNYRFSLEQSLSLKLALFADYSLYSPATANFKKLDGWRYDAGFKYFYKSGLEMGGNYKNLFWFSASYGLQKQAVRLDALDQATGQVLPVDFRRRVEGVQLGSGVSLVYRSWSIDLGLRLGLKKRDVDVLGRTEAEDDAFQVEGQRLTQLTFETEARYYPDFVLLFRLGYSLFYF